MQASTFHTFQKGRQNGAENRENLVSNVENR